MEINMGLSPVVLYDTVLSDVAVHLPSGPVGPVDERPDTSCREFACSALLTSLLKKWEYANTSAADLNAKMKFLASNKKCKDWVLNLEWESDQLLYGNFLREIDLFLHPEGKFLFDSYYYLLEAGRTGPGSSLGASGQSMYAKLWSSKLTSTSACLYNMYKTYASLRPEWSNAENFRYDQYGEPSYVNSSRSSFVPKSQDISRMICTEPSLNMFFQLGLGTLIESRLATFFNLKMHDQPKINQWLARKGSIDGQYSTIDLSSASDSISLGLCRSIFPAWFFETLLELRSPNTLLDGESVPLDMVSTMGNGFTFPLQTLIFSCLIRAAYRTQHIAVCDRPVKNWGCFGDDLIVDKRAYRDVCRLLSILGFQLNSSKTFNEGRFRESCGSDWFLGQPVRGVYIRRLSSPQDIFVAINLLNEWSSHTGVLLNSAIQYLLTGLSEKDKNFLVPYDEGVDTGIRVPQFLLPKVSRDSNGSILYRVYQSVAKKIRIGDGTIHVPRNCKRLRYNPSGLLLSFIHGEVKNFTISLRQSRILYRSKRRCTPFWDYNPTESRHFGSRLDWERWETALLGNFS